MLNKEKKQYYKQAWNKLDNGMKINRIKLFVETEKDKNSLILCDELTAGTETSSATGIVASTLSALLKKEVNFIFTTHLHGLMNFAEITENKFLEIYHFKILVTLCFKSDSYQIVFGSWFFLGNELIAI